MMLKHGFVIPINRAILPAGYFTDWIERWKGIGGGPVFAGSKLERGVKRWRRELRPPISIAATL